MNPLNPAGPTEFQHSNMTPNMVMHNLISIHYLARIIKNQMKMKILEH